MKNGRWIALAMLCIAALTTAQPDEDREPMHGLGMLDLSPEQHEEMGQLRIAFVRQTMPIETDLRVNEMELASLWRADKLNAKAIVAKVKEIAEARTKLELARVNHRLETYNLLTPEQRERARKMFARGHGNGGERRMMRGMGRKQGRGGKGRVGAQGRCDGECQDCIQHGPADTR